MNKKFNEFIESCRRISFGESVWLGREMTSTLLDVAVVVVLVGLLPAKDSLPVIPYCVTVVAICFGMMGVMTAGPSRTYVDPIFDFLESNLSAKIKATQVFT